MSASIPSTTRRSFLAGTAAVVAAPAVAVGALAESAAAATPLPDYAPIPPSALGGPAVNERGSYVGRVERTLYWVTDASTRRRS